MKLTCSFCHTGAARSERAGMPKSEVCAKCHTDRQIASVKLPTRRVYKVPDYVFFSHARHAAAHLRCEECHGDVASMELITLARPTSMQACMDCHRERKATMSCTGCHELLQ